MSSIILHCANEQLANDVRAWLSGALLPLSMPAELHISVGTPAAAEADGRAEFRQGRVRIRGATSAHAKISLVWGLGLGSAEIDASEPVARVVVSREGLEQGHELYRSFLLNVCILMLRKTGLHHVHAAALVDPRDRGWLLVGSSGSGKSTTTALLAQCGWRIGTDDIAFLSARGSSGVTAFAWRDHIALRADSASAIGTEGGLSFGSRRKTGWLPEALGSTWAPAVVPSVLAFTSVHKDEPTSMHAMSPGDALRMLLHNAAWVMLDAGVAESHLELLTSLVRQSSAYELRLGADMYDTPERLIDLTA